MTILSMTGFGRGEATAPGGARIVVEAKSVNHRYADVAVKAPRAYASFEIAWSGTIKSTVSRGRVDLTVRRDAAAGGLSIRWDAVEALIEAHERIQQRFAGRVSAEPPRIDELWRLPNVVAAGEGEADPVAEGPAADEAVAAALAAMVVMRRSEGARLEEDLRQILGRISRLRAEASAMASKAPAQLHDRLQQRLQALGTAVAVSPERLAAEVAILAERADVSEEITRLGAHIEQFESLLSAGEPVGRRLDFLGQELHREATTLGNKASETALVRIALELKAEIDRLKEQVMNVE